MLEETASCGFDILVVVTAVAVTIEGRAVPSNFDPS